MRSTRPAVFLDRDGTITVERGYVSRPEDLELIEGASAAIRSLNEAGLLVVVVSNQSGVARGLMTEDDLASVHRAMEDLLAADGAMLDGAYYCPNHLSGSVARYAQDASCRKPELGMLELAVRDLGIDVASSVMVGDQITDVEFANRASMPAVVVLTGKGAATMVEAAARGLTVAAGLPDLAAAARWIVARLTGGAGGQEP
ncbi:MAG: HAD family hydrolase [Candidatus Eisenbacteria bacterium]|nr:HAD family hydrolase [Candidatus Eisenbacteria bacterium]